MRRRDLKILILALVGVSIVYAFVARRERPSGDENLFFPNLAVSAVDSIAVRDAARSYVLARSGDAWTFRDEAGGPTFFAEPGMVELAVQQMARLARSELTSVVSAKQHLFSVDDAGGVRMTAKGVDGTLADIIVGKRGPDGMSSYVREPGSEEVYLSGGFLASVAGADRDQWRLARLTSFDINDVSRIVIETTEARIALERAERGGWRMTEPEERPAAIQEADSALLMLESLRATDHADDLTPAECGLSGDEGRPDAAVTVELVDGGTETIWFERESDDSYFVLRPDRYDRDVVYRISARVVGRIVRPVADYVVEEPTTP